MAVDKQGIEMLIINYATGGVDYEQRCLSLIMGVNLIFIVSLVVLIPILRAALVQGAVNLSNVDRRRVIV